MPDIVVANAGRGLGGSVKDADLSRFESILQINVTGTLALLQRAAREMLPQQERGYPDTAADIVVLGSVVGRHVSPFSAVYGATKFAVHALTEGLRRELGPKGVRVTLIAPGITVSGFQDAAGYSDAMVQNFEDKFGPLLVAEDVAETIRYTVSLPPRVHVSDLVVRPTRQDYP
jgi:NADP-dependent 3-hydroxy acid dehydrogenase YdfG